MRSVLSHTHAATGPRSRLPADTWHPVTAGHLCCLGLRTLRTDGCLMPLPTNLSAQLPPRGRGPPILSVGNCNAFRRWAHLTPHLPAHPPRWSCPVTGKPRPEARGFCLEGMEKSTTQGRGWPEPPPKIQHTLSRRMGLGKAAPDWFWRPRRNPGSSTH